MKLDSMNDLRRTHYCGTLRPDHINQQVVVAGFVQRRRDLGQLLFIDLRDHTGIVQLAFDDRTERDMFDKASNCKSEYVIMAKGTVRERESKNTEIPTGDIEIYVNDLRVLSAAGLPPFEIVDNSNVKEELRLKYRYLDLRRGQLQRNLIMRHEIARVTRQYFYENGFLEIETPMMIKSTPEGARDYLVPSRLHKGKFYALPQSPQIYKQLLMVSGFDRYIQLARCFRDEDLRADRQPEFTQIDLEMSFVDQNDIMQMVEGYIKRLFDEVLGVDIALPIPRLTYQEAMNRYGTDKPDTRYGMEIIDISDAVRNCEFGVFTSAIAEGGSVRAIVAKGAAAELTRKTIDKLTEYVRGIGAKGLAFIRYADDKPACSFAKFFGETEFEQLLKALDCQKGDVALIVADKNKVTLPVLGALRQTVAKQLGIIPDGYNFVWITEFPFFEWDDESESYVAMHHPFTMPMEDSIDKLETDPGSVKAKAYDLVLNGVELSSGSIRITDHALQQKMFKALGLSQDEIESKFGFLVEAYKYASPPHGGAGIGLDRLAMLMCNAKSLRDVVAFPKLQNASEPMSDSPAYVDQAQLKELNIKID